MLFNLHKTVVTIQTWMQLYLKIVKVPNSLLVSGVTGSDVVFDYLGQYRKIERVIKVTSR